MKRTILRTIALCAALCLCQALIAPLAARAGQNGDLDPVRTLEASPVSGNASNAAPESVTITNAPDDDTTAMSASITIGGDGVAKYQYRLDGGEWSALAAVSAPLILHDLAPVTHVLEIRGADDQGNVQATPNTITWTVEPGDYPVRAGLKMAAGYDHSLAIADDGTLWAWGANAKGQLGVGTNADSAFPIQVGTDANWASVAANGRHSLAIKTDGSLWAWGDNASGQLGDGTNVDKNEPVRIGLSTNWAYVAAGGGHSLGIKKDGTLWAWGSGLAGQLGDGSMDESAVLLQVGSAGDWHMVSAGLSQSYGIRTGGVLEGGGALWAWGDNSFGQLGDGTLERRTRPVRIGDRDDWTFTTAGAGHGLGVTTGGELYAWGLNAWGQLGDGATLSSTLPLRIRQDLTWSFVAGGGTFSMAVATDGSLWTWGDNRYGQLGDGTMTQRESPVMIDPASGWSALAAGSLHMLAARTGDGIRASGYGNYGQLGAGSFDDAATPARVLSFDATPQAVLLFVPDPVTSLTTANILVGGDVTHYKYRLDYGAWGEETVTSQRIALTGLTEGAHIIEAIGRTASGTWQSESAATAFSWRVDPTGGAVTITGVPFSPTATTSAILTVSGTYVTHYVSSLDGGAWSAEAPVTEPISLVNLLEGEHTVQVKGRDAEGNWQQVPTSVTWTVDLDAPDNVTLTGAPPEVSTSRTAEITISGIGVVRYVYSLDGGAWSEAVLATRPLTLSGLSLGDHTLEVRGVDAAGNVQSRSTVCNWEVRAAVSPGVAVLLLE